MDLKLCYVDDSFAYFTTQDLDRQWGDGWNKAPYEHNAGAPYRYGKYEQEKGHPLWEVIRVAFYAPLETPAAKAKGSSRYSVAQINAGAVAWLATDEWAEKQVSIMAGVSIPEFIRKVESSGGEVYLTKELWERLSKGEGSG
jgi:hypothetical protein